MEFVSPEELKALADQAPDGHPLGKTIRSAAHTISDLEQRVQDLMMALQLARSEPAPEPLVDHVPEVAGSALRRTGGEELDLALLELAEAKLAAMLPGLRAELIAELEEIATQPAMVSMTTVMAPEPAPIEYAAAAASSPFAAPIVPTTPPAHAAQGPIANPERSADGAPILERQLERPAAPSPWAAPQANASSAPLTPGFDAPSAPVAEAKSLSDMLGATTPAFFAEAPSVGAHSPILADLLGGTVETLAPPAEVTEPAVAQAPAGPMTAPRRATHPDAPARPVDAAGNAHLANLEVAAPLFGAPREPIAGDEMVLPPWAQA